MNCYTALLTREPMALLAIRGRDPIARSHAQGPQRRGRLAALSLSLASRASYDRSQRAGCTPGVRFLERGPVVGARDHARRAVLLERGACSVVDVAVLWRRSTMICFAAAAQLVAPVGGAATAAGAAAEGVRVEAERRPPRGWRRAPRRW